MLSERVILPVLLAKLKNCCESSSGKSEATPMQPRFGTQCGFQTLIWNKVLFRHRCKNSCRELAQWTGRDLCQAGLNELVLRSDKCLNRFGDYVEK
ncbi:hypothetical protein AVEN_105931-1 [Araneus ventricosus]|uniref:Uncharacterized protein n=1 Tax=Araneus ventricosus TaxID=182803 RepID=A0A4Y2DWG3_ARAVE|nr:hypothetical protein AVEN_105931-1 [Araneus ventricosus]